MYLPKQDILIINKASMSAIYPNFDAAARKNQAYLRDYGQEKSVFNPVWAGAEGDRVALQRSSYPSESAQQYFNGPIYNQQFRNIISTGMQGKAKKITDRYALTGMADYSTYGRNTTEYELVEVSSGVTNTDMIIGMLILGTALAFIMLYR